MPANLPPQYFEKEKELRAAKTPQEKISIMEELLSIIPKHKGTEKLQALYKTKIAKLKSQAQKKPSAGKQELVYTIEKAGAGQVVLTGPPNSGKSSLIKALTNARPDIAEYPFTTTLPSPAMMAYENIQIQLIDTPPVTPDFFEFWQAELIKNADAVLVLLDLTRDPGLEFLAFQEKLKERSIELVSEKKEVPQERAFFQKRTLIIANKFDLVDINDVLPELREVVPAEMEILTLSTSAQEKLDDLKKRIFTILQVLRVYSKVPGKKADLKDPYIFKIGSDLMDMARAVHRDFAQNLRFARIWGTGKYQGQKVNRNYLLQDEDIIELHI